MMAKHAATAEKKKGAGPKPRKSKEPKAGAFESLPALHDAVAAASKKKLAAAMAKAAGLKGKKAAKYEKRCRKAIDEMRGMQIKTSARWLLVPRLELGEGGPRVTFELVDREDARPIHWYAEAGGYDGDMPGHDFESVEWSEALGYRVWTEGDFSQADLDQFLADCVNELVKFHSWTAAKRHDRIVKLAGMCNDAEVEFADEGERIMETPESVAVPSHRSGWCPDIPLDPKEFGKLSADEVDARRREAERMNLAERSFRLELAQRLNDADILL